VNRDDDGRRIDFHRDGRADDGTEMGRPDRRWPGGLRSGSVDARVPVVVPSTTTHWLDTHAAAGAWWIYRHRDRAGRGQCVSGRVDARRTGASLALTPLVQGAPSTPRRNALARRRHHTYMTIFTQIKSSIRRVTVTVVHIVLYASYTACHLVRLLSLASRARRRRRRRR
jgi:hypothetical protein